ncbi:MAG: hypothetical protein ACOYXC_11720 [Candidatus Rifleibacteriota bacterium]
MAKIEKDQFEEYLEQHAPDEEPSSQLFDRLQKEAVWNQPTADTGPAIYIILLAVIIIALVVVAGIFAPVEADKPAEKPVIQPVIKNEPVHIIADAKSVFKEKGAYQLMKNRSDDFNLSFSADKNCSSLFDMSRELNSSDI